MWSLPTLYTLQTPSVEPAVKKDFFDSIGNFVENVGDRIGDRVHNSTENIRNNTRDLFSDPDHNGAEPLMIGSTFWAGFAGTVMVGAGLLF
jgi:hypothetical protein